MPELPEAERARLVLQEHASGGRSRGWTTGTITFCRPHGKGEIDAVLRGVTVTAAHRRGKHLWLETDAGVDLSLHLGMSGSFRVDEPPAPRGWAGSRSSSRTARRIALRDKRRLGRALLDASRQRIGPDAATVSRDAFRKRVGSSRAAVKARLLDQSALAGVGNLLADEALWHARIDPRAPASSLGRSGSTACGCRCGGRSARRSCRGPVGCGRVCPSAAAGICPGAARRCPRGRRRPHDVLVPGRQRAPRARAAAPDVC